MPSLPSSPPPVPWAVVYPVLGFLCTVIFVGGALYLALRVSDVLAQRRSRAGSDLETGMTPPTMAWPAKSARSTTSKVLAAAAVLKAAREKISKTVSDAPAPTICGPASSAIAAKTSVATPTLVRPVSGVAAAAALQVPRLAHLTSSNAGDEVPTARYAARLARPKLRPSPLRGVAAISEPEPVLIIASVPLRLNVSALPIAVTLANYVEETEPSGDDVSIETSVSSLSKEEEDDDDDLAPFDESILLSSVDMWIPGLVGSRSTGSLDIKNVVVGVVSSITSNSISNSGSLTTITSSSSSSTNSTTTTTSPSPSSPHSLTSLATTTNPSSPPPLSSRPILGDSRYSNIRRAPHVRAQVAKLGVPLRGSSGNTHRRIGDRVELERDRRETFNLKENEDAGAWIRRPSPVRLA